MSEDDTGQPPVDDAARQRIRVAASKFLMDAVPRLELARVLPVPGHQSPWLDYAAIWNVLGHEVGTELVAVLKDELPHRFGRPSMMPRAEDYPTALLRAVVAMATVAYARPVGYGPDVQPFVDELVEQVQAPDQTVRCIRLLTHLDVSAIAGSSIHGVRLEPVRGLMETLSRELKEAASEVDRTHVPLGSREPRTLAVAELTGPTDTWILAMDARPALDHVVSVLRLVTGATIAQSVEVFGLTSVVHATGPMAAAVDPETDSHWRRVGVLTPPDVDGIKRLVDMMVELYGRPPKKLPSLLVAINRFNRSHRPAAWQDVVVDLSIGLEAAFSTAEREDLTLALRSRAAHLLALPGDPADRIFADVGELLALRGRVVHGSVVEESHWTNLFARHGINQIMPRDRLEVAFDRWRDLLRRAILARLLLSEVGGPGVTSWPLLGGKDSIDGQLIGPRGRRAWRHLIRTRAAELGIARAWRRSEPLHDYLHDPWGDDLAN